METPTSSLSSSSSSFESLSASLYSNSVCRRKGSYRYRSSKSSRFEESTHYFLGSCYLCKKNLCDGRDIYMYRGDTPFCSEECRQQQIKFDEAQEKSKKLRSAAVKAKERRSDKPAAVSWEPGAVQSRATATATMACWNCAMRMESTLNSLNRFKLMMEIVKEFLTVKTYKLGLFLLSEQIIVKTLLGTFSLFESSP